MDAGIKSKARLDSRWTQFQASERNIMSAGTQAGAMTAQCDWRKDSRDALWRSQRLFDNCLNPFERSYRERRRPAADGSLQTEAVFHVLVFNCSSVPLESLIVNQSINLFIGG